MCVLPHPPASFPLAFLAWAALLATPAYAQVPTKCLEIESILVDACISATDCPSSTEGMNEMARFITGPDAIALGDLQFQFYSSTFRGIVQNATTAALTSQLNATIQSCGHLLEPPGGIIPPGSRVLFITSTNMCVQANPFTALNDTLYIIFQAPGNSQGHFKNNDLVGQPITATPAAPLMRWLRINVTGTACGDTATYDANLLVNIYGTYGGLSEENDGATVNFAWPGAPVATYVNHGCMAAFEPTTVSIISGGGPVVCGASAQLEAGVNGPYSTLLWHGGGGSFSNAQSTSTSYTPGGGDNGDVELSFCAIDACGDSICTTVTITTGETPQVTVVGDTTLCSSFETSVLTASGADTYLWSTGETTASIVAAITGPVGYWVVGSNACGSDTAYITPRWMHTTTYYTNVSCNGAADGELSASGTGGEEPYTYLWSTGSTDSIITGLAPGSYTYTITDADGCTLTGGTSITEPSPLVLTVGPDTTICPGGTAVLQAMATGGTPGYYFTWSPEGPIVSPTETTVYTVEVHDLRGCEGEPAHVTLTVPSEQSFTLSSTALEGCAPHCVTFSATATGNNAYNWDFGDGNTATGDQVQHCFAAPGQYTVHVEAQFDSGCPPVTSTFGEVIVAPAVVAAFTWSPSTPAPGDMVHFADESQGATQWSWLFGDADSSTASGPAPEFTFTEKDCYPITLMAFNAQGCSDTTVVEICLSGSDTLLVPNIFSPNGDGLNDLFRIEGVNKLDLHLYNRWGQLVAWLERPRQTWDGRTPAGEPCSPGTYFYVLRATTNAGEEVDRTGTITLVR